MTHEEYTNIEKLINENESLIDEFKVLAICTDFPVNALTA